MESLLILLILTGLGSDRRVATLPANTLKVKVGDAATLQCPLLSRSNMTVVSWYRQMAGKGPLLVLTYSLTNTSTMTYGPGVRPDKFTTGVDGSLLIHGSEESDSAVYYCGLSTYKTPRH